MEFALNIFAIFVTHMAINKLSIESFLEFAKLHPVLDVRSPGEYSQAHIPVATSFPLFTNDERRVVGTAYKQESREKAIKIGLDYFGKNMVSMVEHAEKIILANKGASREVGVHCWRGGMRSAAVAWLLDLYGFKVNLLVGGYKSYRHWVHKTLDADYDLKILGGYTGSNKTGVIKRLKNRQHVIDLEALAGHKGSAYGNLDLIPQPSQEHFENLLATELNRCVTGLSEQVIWLEGESQRIGSVNIPLNFFKTMRKSPLVFLNIPFEQRLDFIVEDYGKFDKEKLINATLRIKKKLGGLEMKTAINCLLEDDIKGCFTILLKYYDKLYLKSMSGAEFKNRATTRIDSDTVNPEINLEKICSHVN